MRGAVLGVVLLAGCDPLADTRYVGEPMFTLTGTIVSPAKGSEPVGGLALVWQDTGGAGGPGISTMVVPVELEFPSTFRISVPLPGPDAAKFAFDDSTVELAEAYMFAVADPRAARVVPRGMDRTHALVWASGDVAEGTQAAAYLGGPVSAGYHLRRFATVTEPSSPQQLMISRCVESGATQPACAARRGYQLGAADDDEQLRIVVTP